MTARRVFTIPMILVLLLVFVLNASGSVSAPAAVDDFSILLGRPTDHSVTANVIPDASGEISFEYGTTPAYGSQTSAAACTADEPVEVMIDWLTPDTLYYYQLRFRATSGDPWTGGGQRSFHTQRPEGSAFTFTIVSDSHLGQYGGQTDDELALYERTLLNVVTDQPDFHIDLGDSFAMDPLPPYGTGLGTGMTEANADAAYRVQLPYWDLLNGSALFYVLGNHENEEGWNWDDTYSSGNKSVAIVGLKARKKYVPNPIPDAFYSGNTDALPPQFVAEYPALSSTDPFREDYYAWQWGDALFVVIDPYHYSMTWPNDDGAGYGGEGQDGEASGDRWDWSLGIDQYLWLKETLETSDATYKFVFTHHVTGGSTPYGRGGIGAAPYFEWGGKNADGTWGWDTERPAAEGWDIPVHQLMVENGVDVFFHGHDHMFAMEELDGIIYWECPKPDDAGYTWEPYSYGYNEGLYPDALAILPNSGHTRVTVSPAQVSVEYVRSYLPGDGNNGQVDASIVVPAGGLVRHNLTVAVDPVGAGTTNPAVGTHSYLAGGVVNVTAAPSGPYTFDYWSGACAGNGACQVTMDADKSVTAHFKEVPVGSAIHVADIGAASIKDSGVAGLSITTSAAVAAGDAIVVAYATDTTADLTLTVSDPAGNKYHPAGMALNQGQLRTYLFAAYNVNALPASSTITIQQGVTGTPVPAARAAVASVFRGLAPAGALEQTANASGSSTTPSSGAATTVAADQLLIGAVGTEGPGSDTAGTWGNSFTAGPRAGTTATTGDAEITVSLGWRSVAAAGQYSAAKSGITSRDWASVIATFKTAATGISYIGSAGSAQSKTAGTSLAITTNAAVAAGDDILIAFAADPAAAVSSATDSAGNAYSNVADVTGADNVRTTILAAYDVTALPSGSAITLNHASATARAAVANVFRGLDDDAVLDRINTGSGSGTSPSSGATSTTTQANELLIGAIATEGPHNDPPGVWLNSFTEGSRLGTNFGSTGGDDTDVTVSLGWRIVGSTGAYSAAKGSLPTSRDWAAATATFMAPAPSAGKLGDVNRDGQADSTDALIVLSADVGMNTAAFCPMNCGDVDGNGQVDSTDALIIMSYDVGMSVPNPVGQPGCPSSITQPAGCTP